MPESTCPTSDELSAMLGGRLDESRLETVLEHVDQCQQCQQRIEDVEAPDPLAEQLAKLQGRQLQPSDSSWSDGSWGSKVAKIIDLPVEIGPYRLHRTIAVGGMGTVYEARHRRLGRPFAVKLLHYGTRMSRVEAERVRREWRNHGRLVHPNIVGATDAGISDGQPYLVTERIDGIDLSKLVRQRGPLLPADACEIVRQAAEGLQYAHDQQVIHGDVKPSNLMLNRRGVVKLLDLGTARRLDETRFRSSRSSTTHGTLAYMAPEQLSKSTAGPEDPTATDHRADIYSLGCTLYCLLTGGPPFAAAGEMSNQNLVDSHRSVTPRPLQEVVGEEIQIDPQLQQIVDRMLAKNPADRIDSMQTLVDQIDPLCSGHNVNHLLDGLAVESEHLADPNLSLFELTQGLTRLLKTHERRPRWVAATVVVLLLAGLASVFAILRLRQSPSEFKIGDMTTSTVADSIAPIPVVDPEPVIYQAKTSLGEDLWHHVGPVWKAADRHGDLDGLVLQPASFPGINHWQMETVAPRGRVSCLRWSDSGDQVATVSTDGHVRLFDWRNDRLSLSQIVSHRDHRFVLVDFHRNQPQILVCTADKLLRIDVSTGTIQQQTDTPGAFDMEWVNGQNLVSVASPMGIAMYDPNSFEVVDRLNVDCQTTAWSRDGGRVACASGNSVSIWRFAKGAFSEVPIGRRSIDQTPHDLDFTASLNHLAVLYPYRIEMLSRGKYETTFSVTSKSRFESITFGDSDDKMMLGTNNGIMQLHSAKITRKFHRHQIWGRSKVAWNPKQDCIAIGQDGVLRIVDDRMITVDLVGASKSICAVTMPISDHYAFLSRSGKLVYTNRDGKILSWSTFLPQGNRIVEGFVGTATRSHLAVNVLPNTDKPMQVRIALPETSGALGPKGHTESSEDDDHAMREPVRRRYKDDKVWVERWNDLNKEWQPLLESEEYVKTALLSPNGKLLAVLSGRTNLTILDAKDGKSVIRRKLNQVPLQNGGFWLDDRSLLIAGAQNMSERCMALLDVVSNELSWIKQEPHDCTAAEVALLGKQKFIQVGAVHNVRSTVDGQIEHSIQAERQYGRSHGCVYREPDSSCWFTWGYDYASTYASNASDGVVCWDTEDLIPHWMLVDLGEEQTVTLSPAGQIISATPKATENLVWLIDDGSGLRLKTWDEFLELAQVPKPSPE